MMDFDNPSVTGMEATRMRHSHLVVPRAGELSTTHILAYNLIRTVMAQAAPTRPRAAVHQLQGRGPDARRVPTRDRAQGEGDPAARTRDYRQVLDAIATHRVGDRPDRFEPRLRKRRPKHYAFLMKPRSETKQLMLNRFSKK